MSLCNISLDLFRRLNGQILSKSVEEKKIKEQEFAEMILKNMNMLTDKIQSINLPTQNSSKTQMVARRNCPSWTAGTTIEVYRRWVEDWNEMGSMRGIMQALTK